MTDENNQHTSPDSGIPGNSSSDPASRQNPDTGDSSLNTDKKSSQPESDGSKKKKSEKILNFLKEFSVSWFSSPVKRKVTFQVGAAILAVVVLWLVIPGKSSFEEIGKIGQSIGFPGFLMAQTLLPLVGFPAIPFLVVGSFAFSFWGVLLGTAVAQAIQLPLIYLIGRRVLAGVIKNLSEWFEFPMFQLPQADQVKFIFFIKLVPGLSQSLRHYLLAIYNVPFRQFFIIGWSMSMVFSILTILICQTLKSGGNWNLYLALACVVVIGILVVMIRKPGAKQEENT